MEKTQKYHYVKERNKFYQFRIHPVKEKGAGLLLLIF